MKKDTASQPDNDVSAVQDPAVHSSAKEPPHWQQLMQTLEKFGSKRLQRRSKDARRLLQENGAIHNVFDFPKADRAWQFDPVPVIFAADEWGQLESALVQRAKLLNLILKDLYGPQQLISKGLLPPELIFAHKNFLYPCLGLLPPDTPALSLYSANIAKGRDGNYWVLDDHVQPPLGAGYALETRVIMTRSFPQLFADFQVHRLAWYFRELRHHLARLARHNQHDPYIVMLSPGPDHEAFFEHAYLASYLGYPLVQGGDLTVRDNRVWLKSVAGLRQVDVILRRLDDAYCDSLELRGDSLLGVAGLLQVVRQGNVAVANPIGSSVLENPALMAFLPEICQHYFDEELKIPSVATWWCGQPMECTYVLEHLDRLMIKPIHPIANLPPAIPGANVAQQRQWRTLIEAKPHLFVGQQVLDFATFPAFADHQIRSRESLLSVYLTAKEDSYAALPGGLSRVKTEQGKLQQPNQPGGRIKDTWVLTPEPDKQVNLWLLAQPDQLIKPQSSSLPSRAAENLFWSGRYAERAEQTARLLRSILVKLREVNEFRDADDRQALHHLLRALTHVTLSYPGFVGEGSEQKLADPREELLSLVLDLRPGGIRSSLNSLWNAAYAIRDLMPADAWRVVNNVKENWNPKISSLQIGSGRLHRSINQLIIQLAGFSGLMYENMSRETAWHVLNIGRRLERAMNLIALLRAILVPSYSGSTGTQVLEAVLATSNSLIVFRRRYRSFIQLAPVLELLLMDENYPRALACQLRQLKKHILSLPYQGELPRPDEQLVGQSIHELQDTTQKRMIQMSIDEDIYPLLETLLENQEERLQKLSEQLMRCYFSPMLEPRQLGSSYGGAR